jgi:hypothetical protein
MSPRATLLVAVCAIGVVMLVAVRRLTVPVDSATVTVESPEHAELVAPVAETPREKASAPDATGEPAHDATPAVTIEPPAAAVVLEAAPAESSPAPTVTISGCLEREDETLQLTDTEGLDAPRARSWKSAFLAKRSASIELIEGTSTPTLPRFQGERVAVTGTLAGREMQVRSVRRLGSPCD